MDVNLNFGCPMLNKLLPFILNAAFLSFPVAAAVDDQRLQVELPEEVYNYMMSDMRRHMQALTEVAILAGRGDFEAAAQAAESGLGKKSSQEKKERQQGKNSGKHSKGSGHGKGKGNGIDGKKKGRGDHQSASHQSKNPFSPAPYMPLPMKSIGKEMHKNADELVRALRDAAYNKDYANVMTKMGKVGASCNTCHSAYRVVVKKESF